MLVLKLRTAANCLLFAAVLVFIVPVAVNAHCDTMDGPVIMDAIKALESGDVNPVLKWVSKDDEQEIKDVFNRTLIVRAKSPEAKKLADNYFFETLVRFHRAGEGAPYTGLKPAGSEIDPSVNASDKAIESGSVDFLTDDISSLVADGIRERFEKVLNAKRQKDESVDAGREYVEAYIEFIHYVEKIYLDASGAAAHEGHSKD